MLTTAQPPTPTSTAQALGTGFPQYIEVPIVLKIKVHSQEFKDRFLDPTTGAPTVQVIADLYDIFTDNDLQELEQINNLTYAQVQATLREQAGI